MQGAEAFFNKPSPFQKAAEKEREEAEAAAEADDRVANAVDSAETAVETTGEVISVRFRCYLRAHGMIGLLILSIMKCATSFA